MAKNAATATKASPKRKRIRVRVPFDYVGSGYYGDKRRRAGDVFTIWDSEFSAQWMEHVSTDVPANHPRGTQAAMDHKKLMDDAAPPGQLPTGEDDVLGLDET